MKQPAQRHFEASITLPAAAEGVFAYIDDHARFSSHMNKSSWMMGGGHMDVSVDTGNGQKIGSHIRLSGTVFGMRIFLDEAVTVYDPPRTKAWQTVGNLRLLVIGHYTMKIRIVPEGIGSACTVSIDYELPRAPGERLVGFLFGGIYARWCVRQMLEGIRMNFLS